MRVSVIGSSAIIPAVRAGLSRSGVTVDETFADYTIILDPTPKPHIAVDGVDCEFERLMVKEIANCSPSGEILLLRGNGVNTSDSSIRILTPPDEYESHAVEHGIIRAMGRFFHLPTPPWWKRLGLRMLKWCGLLLLVMGMCPTPAFAQRVFVTNFGDASINVSDNAARLLGQVTFSSPQHTICDSGCSSASDVTASGTIDDFTPLVVTLQSGAATARVQVVSNTGPAAFNWYGSSDGGVTYTSFVAPIYHPTLFVWYLQSGFTLDTGVPSFLTLNVAGMDHIRFLESGGYDAEVNVRVSAATSAPFVRRTDATAGSNVGWFGGLTMAGGSVSTAAPTYVNGYTDALSLDLAGNLRTAASLVGSLPAGTNAIGKLAANSGVDIGTVAISQSLGANKIVIDQTTPGTTNRVDVGVFPDNEPINIAQLGGIATNLNNGTSGTGTLRVTMASNSTGVLASIGSITTSIVPGVAATNLGKQEDVAHATGDTGVLALAVRKDANAQTTNADGDNAFVAVDAYSAAYVRQDHPNRIRCFTAAVSTATILTAFAGSCATPGAGLSLYITDVSFASNASGIAADAFPTLKYGTGGACGTGTTVVWGAFGEAAIQDTIFQSFTTPIKIPANNELCWMNTTAGSKFVSVHGFIAP